MGSYYRVRGQLPPLTTLEAATQTPASRLTASGGGSLTALAPEWNALADAVGAPAFLRPGWFDAWPAPLGPRDLELVGVRSDDGLAGVVRLVRRAAYLRAAAKGGTPLFGAV